MRSRASGTRAFPFVVGGVLALGWAAVGLLVGIPAPLGLGLAIALVLAAPTSRLLSRRILINSAIALGWFPATWWLPFGFGSLGRTGAFLAVALGSTVAASIRIARSGESLLPRVNRVDLLIPLAAAATLWLSFPWWSASTTAESLSRLVISNWDHAGHFSMIYLQRAFEMLPTAGDGPQLVYASYVQYTDSMVNGAIELGVGPEVMTAPQEILLYGPGSSAIYCWLAIMVTAGIVQLPKLRRHPVVALITVVFSTTVIVLGPGGGAFGAGHLNIGYAGLSISALVLLAAPRRDLLQPLVFFAGAGLILAASGAWALLAPLAIAVGVALITTSPGWRRALRRHAVPSAVTAALVAAGLVVIVIITSGYSVVETLGLYGRVVGSDLGDTLVVGALALVLCGWPLHRAHQLRYRIEPQLWVLGVILGWTTAFGIYQMVVYGEFSYYFWKLLQGTQLASLGSVAVGAARVCTLLPPPRPLPNTQRAWAALTVPILLVATLLSYGSPVKTLGAEAPSVEIRNSEPGDANAAAAGDRLLKAYAKAQEYPKGTVTYYAVAAGDSLSPRSNAWLHAMLGDWTVDVQAASEPSNQLRRGKNATPAFVEDVAKRIEQTLEIGGPDHVVIVAPEMYDTISEQLPADLRDQLTHF